MNPARVIRRFLPGFAVTILYWLRFRCLVSPRAEVDFHPNLEIGRGTRIGSFTKIKASNGRLTIGSNVSIGNSSFIGSGTGGTRIGDHCLISNNVTILSSNYRYDRLDQPIMMQGVTSKGVEIGADVWLGSGVIVLDGSVIGESTIVTPGSVVSSRLPAGVIVQGNPAKVIFERR